jgi:adenylyltransferase/sulfurtransferase
MNYISAEQLAQSLRNKEDLVLLDIRENYEYEVCNIKSLHIPMHEIPARAVELKPDHKTIVICRTGSRAAAVANFLNANYNFSNLAVLEGGIVAYAEKVDHELDTEY